MKVPGTTDRREHTNEVRIIGRVSQPAQERDLPSGDAVAIVRVIVDRGPESVRGSATVDTLDCAAWPTGLRRRVSGWHRGDVVEVRGAVRRRFFRAGGSVASRVEIEMSAARIVRRARRRVTE